MSPARGVSNWLRPSLCGIDLYEAIFTESSEKWQIDPPKIDRLAADISLEALRELSGGFAVSASTFLRCQPLADFTNPTVETAGRAQTIRWLKRDGCHRGPSAIGQNPLRSPMKWKLLLAVVWIALAGAIDALIIFPPDSVLTAEFRH